MDEGAKLIFLKNIKSKYLGKKNLSETQEFAI